MLLRRLDLGLLRFLRTNGHTPAIEGVVLPFTRSGEHGILWQLIALAGALAHGPARRETYLRSGRVVLVAYLINIAVKNLVRRARPLLEEELPALSPVISELSFPSAHSTTSFAAAAAMRGALPAGPLYAAAAAMALSRVYVGVHYPTDVAAGAALGTAVGRVCP